MVLFIAVCLACSPYYIVHRPGLVVPETEAPNASAQLITSGPNSESTELKSSADVLSVKLEFFVAEMSSTSPGPNRHTALTVSSPSPHTAISSASASAAVALFFYETTGPSQTQHQLSYSIQHSDLFGLGTSTVEKAMRVVYGALMKILTSALLLIFSALIIKRILEARRAHRALFERPTPLTSNANTPNMPLGGGLRAKNGRPKERKEAAANVRVGASGRGRARKSRKNVQTTVTKSSSCIPLDEIDENAERESIDADAAGVVSKERLRLREGPPERIDRRSSEREVVNSGAEIDSASNQPPPQQNALSKPKMSSAAAASGTQHQPHRCTKPQHRPQCSCGGGNGAESEMENDPEPAQEIDNKPQHQLGSSSSTQLLVSHSPSFLETETESPEADGSGARRLRCRDQLVITTDQSSPIASTPSSASPNGSDPPEIPPFISRARCSASRERDHSYAADPAAHIRMPPELSANGNGATRETINDATPAEPQFPRASNAIIDSTWSATARTNYSNHLNNKHKTLPSGSSLEPLDSRRNLSPTGRSSGDRGTSPFPKSISMNIRSPTSQKDGFGYSCSPKSGQPFGPGASRALTPLFQRVVSTSSTSSTIGGSRIRSKASSNGKERSANNERLHRRGKGFSMRTTYMLLFVVLTQVANLLPHGYASFPGGIEKARGSVESALRCLITQIFGPDKCN